MSSIIDQEWSVEHYRQRWSELLRHGDKPVIQLAHELLELTAAGTTIEIQLSDDGRLVEILLADASIKNGVTNSAHPPGIPVSTLSFQIPAHRPGVVVRGICARLAGLGRKPEKQWVDPYGDEVEIPVSMIVSNQTLTENLGRAQLPVDESQPQVRVRYTNSASEPYHISMALCDPKD